MTRTLWGRGNSVNVQKVVWALAELGLAHERVEAGGAHGIVGDARYRAMNPNGLVPTLQEDDFVLWESNAILRYLADAYGGASGGPLALPSDPRGRARVEQWLDWEATTLKPAMRDAFLQLVRTAPEARDAGLLEASRAATEAAAATLDRHLADHDHVAGPAFGIADIALGCAVHRWFALPVARAERPNLRRWYEGIAQRSAASAVLTLPIT